VLRRKKLEKKFDEIQNKVRARKEGATDDDVIELLGSNVDGPSYDNYECGDVGANTRCYAQVHLLPCCNSHGMVPTNCSFSDAKGARRGLRLLWLVDLHFAFSQHDFCQPGKSLVRKKWSDQADETMGDYLCGQVP